MHDAKRDYQPSTGALHGFVGTILMVLAGSLLANIDENPAAFRTLGLIALAGALYVIVAGAVARGIQLARE